MNRVSGNGFHLTGAVPCFVYGLILWPPFQFPLDFYTVGIGGVGGGEAGRVGWL